jgi:beta-galactosidase
MRANVTTDGMDPREDLSQYRLVIAPTLYCVDAQVAGNLCRYVEQGGVLCLTPRSGVVDEYNVIFDQPAPGPLRAIAGVEVDDYGSLADPVCLRADEPGLAGLAEGTAWADEIILTGARTVASFDQGWLAGTPAIAVNDYGRGKVVYVGTLLRGETLKAFVSWLCAQAAVVLGQATPQGVRAYERWGCDARGRDLRLLFLINYSDVEQTVSLAGQWEDAFTGERCTQAAVPAVDVRLLRAVPV